MYQQQLEYQLAEQEDAKRAAYEDFLREKLLIDEIVRKIFDEDLREQEERLNKQEQVILCSVLPDFSQLRAFCVIILLY